MTRLRDFVLRFAPLQLDTAAYFDQPIWLYVIAAVAAAGCLCAVMRFRSKLARAEADARSAEAERSLFQSQKMEALGQMASGIAHEFNNTMMAVLPWAAILRKQFPHDPTVAKAAANIEDAVRRASSVTRQLLDFAQPKTPQKRVIDLIELVTDQLRLIRTSIPREIDIDFKSSDDSAFVDVDPDQMRQVVTNLALNARDAMPDGGMLRVEVRRPNADERKKWPIDRDNAVVLVVSDTGTGLDEATRTRITDPFFTTKKVGRGTGLGLAVVSRIVEHHGGRFIVGPPGTRGAVFYVVLPGAKAHAPRSRVESPFDTREMTLGGLTVLVVDDESIVAEGIRMLLDSEGASVVVHNSGVAALADIAAGLQPDLVVLDLGMPEMSGEEVHAALRKLFPRLPIIISSGYGDRARIDPLLADGFTTFRQKPYDGDEFLVHVAKIAERVAR